MAEVRAFNAPHPSGLTPVRSLEKPRRWVSTSADGLSGRWTSLSEAEEAELDRRSRAEHDARVAIGRAFTPAAMALTEEQREAAVRAQFTEQWPQGPRQHLRQAHRALAEAEAELARRREHAVAAAAHVLTCEEEARRTQCVVEEIRHQAAVGLQARLTGLSTVVLKGDEAAEAEAMAVAERSRRSLVVARDAEAGIAGGVSEAEAGVRSCRAAVERAAKAVCTEADREIRAELAVLEERVKTMRRRSWDLQAVADYPPARWQPHLRALLVDPEASLLLGTPEEPKPPPAA
jgi:hypothetical protein